MNYSLLFFSTFFLIIISIASVKFLPSRPGEWLNVIKQSPTAGTLQAKDKTGQSVMLTWTLSHVQDPRFKTTMQSICDLTVEAFTPVEINFVKQHPEAIAGLDNAHFKTLEHLFSNGIDKVDWTEATALVAARIRQISDPSRWSDNVLSMFTQCLYVIVTIQDAATKKLIGTATFFIMPGYGYGDIRVTSIAVTPSAQGRGLGKLLMSSIFKVVPWTQRIFLSTRITNETALKGYRSWGFVNDEHPQPNAYHKTDPAHWAFLEYKANQCTILQEAATKLLVS